ncbi:MAG: sialidase family protein, partial [Myxococcota bacterium]
APPPSTPWPWAFAILLVVPFVRRARRRRFVLGAVVVGSLLLGAGGCDVDPFCYGNCGEDAGDAGAPDATETGPVDGCRPSPSGEEECNEVDDDCDGVVDNGFDTATDPQNCGTCGTVCMLPNAFPGCSAGECTVDTCAVGFVDLNGNPTDGCEYECQASGDERCDERDNDCDGATDEGFDRTNDLGNCGACGTVCTFPNASASCVASACEQGACNAGFVDANNDPADGCEYACTAGGVEACNGVDDDCDQQVDEGFALMTDAQNCGTCGRSCTFSNSVGVCNAGICGIGTCNAGFFDIDGDPATGCEYACTPAGADTCNGVDDDCDGAVDESDPMAGTACGMTVGACTQGTLGCQFGTLRCLGARTATPETCNGADDDCDGTTDESTAGAPIPGVGARCGESNVGLCRFGDTVCSGATITCGGAYVAPATEVCDGLDNDCDGTPDDSPTPPTTTPASCALTQGVCAGRMPECQGPAGWACSFPATYQATESLCDGLDNDCDAATDEGCLNPAPSTDVRVDSGDAAGVSNSLSLAVGGNGSDRVYAAWMDLRLLGGAMTPISQILFSRWTGGSDSWSSPTLIDEGDGPAVAPALTVGDAGARVQLVWSDFRGDDDRQVWARRSTNSGGGFGAADQRLDPSSTNDSFSLTVDTLGSDVYVAYEAFVTERRREIFAVRSADGGASWGTPVQVSHGVGTSFVAATPVLRATSTGMFVAWRDNRNGALDVYGNRVARSGTNALTPTATDQRLDTGTAPGSDASFEPAIAGEGSNLYVVWIDSRGGSSLDIYLNRSTDGGASWLPTAVLLENDPLPHDSIEPRVIAPAADQVVVGWVDSQFGFTDIIITRSTDAGATFDVPVRADTGTAPGVSDSRELTLAGNGSLLVAAWSDLRMGAADIYANFSLDGGANWQPTDTRLNSNMPTSDSRDPAAYVSTAAAHVLWVDHRGGPNGDIHYRRLE